MLAVLSGLGPPQTEIHLFVFKPKYELQQIYFPILNKLIRFDNSINNYNLFC